MQHQIVKRQLKMTWSFVFGQWVAETEYRRGNFQLYQCTITNFFTHVRKKMSNHWPYLLRADLVLCRFRKEEVYQNFFETGHGIGWTCCRVTVYPKSCGWLKTEGRYRCPDCDGNQRFLDGSVTGERWKFLEYVLNSSVYQIAFFWAL